MIVPSMDPLSRSRALAAVEASLSAAIALIALVLAGCAVQSRQAAPLTTYPDAAPLGFSPDVMISDGQWPPQTDNTARMLQPLRLTPASPPINVLALSGGGAGIAFGAGVLKGWSLTGHRPDFQVVTGVSAGALLAPWAFLGSGSDATISDVLSDARTHHLLQSQWLRVLFGASLYRGEPLMELVDCYVTPELLRAVAAESHNGRLLLVATTDLDHERTVIWDLGRIAEQRDERARRLFRDVLVASASVPGVFPPVMIRVQASGLEFDEMHVDGGVTTPLFLGPEVAAADGSGEPPHMNIYVLVNSQLGSRASTTPVHTLSILKRGLNALLGSSSRGAVEVALAESKRVGLTLHVTEIPDDYPFAGSLDMEPSAMAALFAFGKRCAVAEQLWSSAAQALSQASRLSSVLASVPPACPAPAFVLPEHGETVAAADTAGSAERAPVGVR